MVVETLLDGLRDDLVTHPADHFEELLGPVAAAALAREQVAPALRACGNSDDPAAGLLLAFVLGRDVPRRVIDAALPRTGADGLAALGLVDAAGTGPEDAVRARVELRPHASADAGSPRTWWVASDLREIATHAPLHPDHVLGASNASMTLARCAVRPDAGRMLDLGTGCGVQALHAATHCRHVTATDVSSRALAFARFTLALNLGTQGAVPGAGEAPAPATPVAAVPGGATGRPGGGPGGGPRWELRQGDLFDPVRGEWFDLVLSNPPFVITPRDAGLPVYTYRDGGGTGDEVVRRVVAGLGAVLRPGGVGQVLAAWEHRVGEGWKDRVAAWVGDPDVDVWVVQREVLDPAQYAEMWVRDAGLVGSEAAGAVLGLWLDDFARRGVEGVGFGIVTVRRPDPSSGAPDGGRRPALRRLEEQRGGVERVLGEHVGSCLAAHDWLVAHGLVGGSRPSGTTAVLEARLRVAPDVTEERHHRPGEEDPAVILLRQGGGFGRVTRAGTAVAGFVGACDGDLSVGQILGALAHLLERPVDEVAVEVLPEVAALVADGLLLPV